MEESFAGLSKCRVADAGYYKVVRTEDRFWDSNNAIRPHFAHAFEWARELAERVGKPLIWWQLPIGNMSLPDQNQKTATAVSTTSWVAPARSSPRTARSSRSAGDQTNPPLTTGT